MKDKTNGRLKTYKSYNFVDKDPAIDIVRTMVQQSRKSYASIQADGGPTPSCLHQWFDGKTKRPQFSTLAAATRAVGGDVMFISPDGNTVKLPHPTRFKGTGPVLAGFLKIGEAVRSKKYGGVNVVKK